MDLINTALPGVFKIRNFTATDDRGTFVKPFNADSFQSAGLQAVYAESYYSVSYKNVIRGMHFQLPPHAHDKIVYVTQGQILDVILDLRQASSTYRQYITIELTELGDSVYIPQGCAHGFLSSSATSTVVYTVSTVYSAAADSGIRWDSFGMNWAVSNPILSERDTRFITLDEFNSPF